MRAMRLGRPGPAEANPLVLEQLDDALPAAGELLLRVSACAVCRTDLQVAEGELAARRLPVTPGHQAVGTVQAVGTGVDGWQSGDRAGVGWLGWTCDSCEFCRGGRENLCAQAQFTGWDRDGGYAESMVVDARYAFRLPSSFAEFDAAPLLCGGVIGYRSLRVSGVQPGQRLGLFGFGASATLTLQVANNLGCEVFVATRSRLEQARARALGAAWAGGYDEPLPARLHAAVTFAPAGAVVVRALQGLERGGTVAINAIHLDGIPAFDYGDLWLERSIRSVANFTRDDAEAFLRLAAEIPIRPEFEVLPMNEANLALQRLKAGDVSGALVLDCQQV